MNLADARQQAFRLDLLMLGEPSFVKIRMMHRVIILEDEAVWRETLADLLLAEGMGVVETASIAQFDATFRPGKYELALIDLGLPDGDGSVLINRVRNADPLIGIIVLTGRDTDQDHAAGLNLGADYFVAKLTPLKVLLAVIKSVLRRHLHQTENPLWQLHTVRHELRYGINPPILLSNQDFLTLYAIMAAEGETVSKKQLVTALGKDFYSYDLRRLDVQMNRLRRKVAGAWSLQLPVVTVRSICYRFAAKCRVSS